MHRAVQRRTERTNRFVRPGGQIIPRDDVQEEEFRQNNEEKNDRCFHQFVSHVHTHEREINPADDHEECSGNVQQNTNRVVFDPLVHVFHVGGIALKREHLSLLDRFQYAARKYLCVI